MALTKDILKANAVLATLTDEQLAAIETLSTNDENSVIGAKTGALHGQYDQDVLLASGLEKNKGEKSYDYVKRVISGLKAKVDSVSTLETQISTLKTEKAEIERQLRDNAGDASIKQKLTDAETRLTQVQKALDDAKLESTNNAKKFVDDVKNVHVNYAFDLAVSGIKFKSTIPESVKNVLINSTKAEILAENKADLIDENGKSILVFRDKDGNILNNPENKLNPFTVTELVTNKLKDVIDFGRKQKGAGTGEGDKSDEDSILDLSAAKNQVEASDLIGKHLMQSGIARQDPKFAEEQSKIWKENNVDKLPIR